MPLTVITAEEEEKLRKKSIYNAPNNLSEKGISPNRIKDFIASPVIGDNISVLAFLKRSIGETNVSLKTIETATRDGNIFVGDTEPNNEVYSFWYDTSNGDNEE